MTGRSMSSFIAILLWASACGNDGGSGSDLGGGDGSIADGATGDGAPMDSGGGDASDCDCDDGNPCTEDACTMDGECVNVPVAMGCDDGDPCTTNDTCVTGECRGEAVTCDDGLACTADRCNPASGCVYEAIEPCCGNGVCDESEGCSSCAEDCACTPPDTCSTATCQDDACVVQPRDCSDGDDCTADSCALVGGCFNPPIACEGDGFCHPGESGPDCSPSCGNGQCASETVGTCSEDCAPTCGNGACDPSEDCTTCPSDCGCPDADACNAYQCVAGGCSLVPLLDCDDGVACTEDTCDPLSGCKHTASALCCGDRACESGEDGSTCSDDCAGVSCCVPHPGGGCDDGTCQRCVCDIEPACCEGDWSTTCVFLSRLRCSTSCTDCDVPTAQLLRGVDGSSLMVSVRSGGARAAG